MKIQEKVPGDLFSWVSFDLLQEEQQPGEIENVRVVIRVRPMDKLELDAGANNIVKVDKINRSITVTKPNSSPGEPPKVYYFDNVYGEESTQVS